MAFFFIMGHANASEQKHLMALQISIMEMTPLESTRSDGPAPRESATRNGPSAVRASTTETRPPESASAMETTPPESTTMDGLSLESLPTMETALAHSQHLTRRSSSTSLMRFRRRSNLSPSGKARLGNMLTLLGLREARCGFLMTRGF
ncbi:hypothetical protein GLAREA_05936 [Glarea lozoyensis ATCC 20868]|uniref:Uncharacterized protein n=1 Tax=Glarea lozoyensis (strain ATCC 20868 / MF5171) TaxID=1116229 RepID=S3D705_GLAL2|nr:uncharacterized protein GLAREA_05936 [Glarea lozoyensis ATCC 20868]EPE32924.1 hypothetical protein GLAREA_05936 [Glarea lozoyensis ATCC 20868]